MPKNSIENIKEKVFKNSLNTCEYIDGYENYTSTITVKCLIHNNEFKTKYENVRRDNRPHHICSICQEEDREENSTKITVICAYCGKEFQKAPSKLNGSKSGLYFCCREHKDLGQRIESNIVEIQPNHYNNGITHYRSKIIRDRKHCCEVCEFDEDIDLLEVHHIDENRKNNDSKNLILLCPICHKKLTTHKYVLINKKIIKN